MFVQSNRWKVASNQCTAASFVKYLQRKSSLQAESNNFPADVPTIYTSRRVELHAAKGYTFAGVRPRIHARIPRRRLSRDFHLPSGSVYRRAEFTAT